MAIVSRLHTPQADVQVLCDDVTLALTNVVFVNDAPFGLHVTIAEGVKTWSYANLAHIDETVDIDEEFVCVRDEQGDISLGDIRVGIHEEMP